MGLEVEVLLPGHLGHATEDVGRCGQAPLDVPPGDDRLATLEALGLDRLGQRHDRGQRLVVDLHGRGAQAGRLERLPEHPAHGVADEHDLAGEQRFVVLDPRVVEAGHVVGREHAYDALDRQCRPRVEPDDPGVGVRRADRVRMEDMGRAVHQVVGVERVAGDVQCGALVRQGEADDRVARAVGQVAHASAHQARSALPSMADR